MKILFFLTILFIFLNISLSAKGKRSYSESYSSSHTASSQVYSSSFASAGATSSASSGSGVRTSSSVNSSSSNPTQNSSSSSSSSSMTNKDGKTKYKIETARGVKIKTNNDPEIRTKIQSDDINKQPKQEVKIGGRKINYRREFKDNEQRKLYKLSLFFIRVLLRKMGYKSKFVRKCTKNLRPDIVQAKINIIHKIGKHKKGYQQLEVLNGLCNDLKDIKHKLNDTAILEKIIVFINHNM